MIFRNKILENVLFRWSLQIQPAPVKANNTSWPGPGGVVLCVM